MTPNHGEGDGLLYFNIGFATSAVKDYGLTVPKGNFVTSAVDC